MYLYNLCTIQGHKISGDFRVSETADWIKRARETMLEFVATNMT